MNTKIKQAVLGGIVGTVVMTMIIFVAPMMGMPKMNPPAMLSGMLGMPIFIGWIMHFMIGIIFALSYVLFFSFLLGKCEKKILKGAFFGITVFIFAQVAMLMMRMLPGSMSAPEGSLFLQIIGSLMGHIIYGIVVISFIKDNSLVK